MNNPFLIMQALYNPAQYFSSLLGSRCMQDPRAQKTMEMLQSHDTEGLKNMATNLCNEYGTTPEQIMQLMNGDPGPFIK